MHTISSYFWEVGAHLAPPKKWEAKEEKSNFSPVWWGNQKLIVSVTFPTIFFFHF